MGSLSIWHWLIVAIVAGILFFGWKQLPDMARSVGRSMRIFKTEIKGMSEDDKKREEARAVETPAEPPAIEPRRAQMVKNDLPTVNGAAPQAGQPAQGAHPAPSGRPRPAPGPRPSTTRTPGAQ